MIAIPLQRSKQMLLLSTGGKQKEFCRWLIADAEGLTIEEQVTYKAYMLAYNIVEDEEVQKEMGRKIWRPNYDKLAEYLHEGMPPEIRDKFIQAFLRVDSLEEGVQKLLKVDSPEVGAQKLLGVESIEEAVLKMAKT